MLILLDHGTPRGLARTLPGHTIFTAQARGLLNAVAEVAFDLLLTTDRRIRYQQNLTGSTKWTRVRLHLERIAAAANTATPGSYVEVEIPFD